MAREADEAALKIEGFELFWDESGDRYLWYDPSTDRLYDREALCARGVGRPCQREECPHCGGMPF